jgi:hypothetical protein
MCATPGQMFPDQTSLVPAIFAGPVPFLLSAHATHEMTSSLPFSKECDNNFWPQGFPLHFGHTRVGRGEE